MPFVRFNLFLPCDFGEVFFDHILSCANVSFTALQTHTFNLFYLLVQSMAHVLVLHFGLRFFISSSGWCLNCPNSRRVTYSVKFFLGLLFLQPLIHLFFPEFALSFLCFFLFTSIAQFLLIELLDLIIELVTLFD